MDDKRIQHIFDDLGKYQVTLVQDPKSLGPRYFLEIITLCRGYINTVSRYMVEILEAKRSLTQQMQAEETTFAIEYDEKMATDAQAQPSVRPNIEDRKSYVNMLLKERRKRILDLKMDLQSLDFLEKAVRHHHRELKDVMSEIKVQRGLMQDEFSTKSFYGDESRTLRQRIKDGDAPMESDGDIPTDELDQLLALEKKTEQEVPPTAPEQGVVVDPPPASEEPVQVVAREPVPEPVPEPEVQESEPERAQEPEPVVEAPKPVVEASGQVDEEEVPAPKSDEDMTSFTDDIDQQLGQFGDLLEDLVEDASDAAAPAGENAAPPVGEPPPPEAPPSEDDYIAQVLAAL